MNRLVKHYPAAVYPLFRQTESVDELAHDIIHTIRADDVERGDVVLDLIHEARADQR